MKIPFLFAFTLVMNTGHSQSKHTISIQSGLFHSYFDQTPLFNFKYTSKDQGIFHGMHLGSVGIEYAYSINSKILFVLSIHYLTPYTKKLGLSMN